MIAMAITQIHTYRRNRHGLWRDGESGALDAPRPLGSCSESTESSRRYAFSERLASLALARTAAWQRWMTTAAPTPTLAGGRNAFPRAPPVACHATGTPLASGGGVPCSACSSSRTHPEATRVRSTEHSHPHIASNALRLAMPPEAATAAARSRRHSIDYQALCGSGYKRGPVPRIARAGSSALSACTLRLRNELQT